MGGDPRQVLAVNTLNVRKPKKSRVYRLVSAAGGHVIAKRCRPETADSERTVYQQILPRLPVPQVRYFGSVADQEPGKHWIFLEDIGDLEVGQDQRDQVLAWLGIYHTSAGAALTAAGTQLPDHGLAYHLAMIGFASEELKAAIELPIFNGESRQILVQTLSLLDLVERRWPSLARADALSPTVPIHGDFVRKNVRLRESGPDAGLCAIDWECAGWGSPGLDLVTRAREHAELPDPATLEAYRAIVRLAWGSDLADVLMMARVGLVLWSIRGTAVNARSLHKGPKAWLMERMGLVAAALRRVIAELGW